MKPLYAIFLLFFTVCFFSAKATHNRAGEITYKRIAPFTRVVGTTTVQVYTYSITITKYTDDGPGIADRCQDTIYFGDGTSGLARRINGPTGGCQCGNTIGCGALIIEEPSYRVKLNIYTIEHTYPGPGEYLIRTFDPNRNEGVRNIPNSVNLPFYVESKLYINSFTGANSSPVFNFAPIDLACLRVCFQHNPGAYDPDGDSLSYELDAPRGFNGQVIPNYFNPEVGAGGSFSINPVTGLLSWCTPQYTSEYNIAFVVKEWRKNTSGVYQLIGYVLRDMQVIVRSCNNSPPSIDVPDICVEAGKTVTANLVVRDPDDASVVSVQAGGGAFSAQNPLPSFNPSSGITFTSTGSSFNVFFSWTTTCDHIRKQPYQTVFKVEDNGLPVKLVSFNTFNIKVVPPTVQGVTATPMGTTMRISWTPSTCSPSNNPLIAYKIYRKQDCNPFVADPCKTGVNPASGFSLIAQTNASVSFAIDSNNGDGLVVGQDYSYLVVAVYEDGTETFASTTVCAKLKRDIPIILNVDVDSTSSTGSVWVRWTRPLTNPENLDTVALPGPYQFNLKHRADANAPYTLVQNFSHPRVAGLDTQFLHTNINTELSGHEYIIEFIADTVSVGSSQRASSIFLSSSVSDRKIMLQWDSKTPWKNYTYSVMRKDSNETAFSLVGTSTVNSFNDTTNLVNGSDYCYYVIGEGEYSDPTVFKPLINASQILCAKPVDTTPPATPTINIDADCPLGTVVVNWGSIKDVYRSDDVAYYVLYYKPLVNGTYSEIATVQEDEQLLFRQDDPNSFSGCYSVKAVDVNGNEGTLSPDFCIENCPEFELPNIFSPNDDGVNDFFKAIKVRQIKEIDLSVVDRWGNLIYTSKDPYFEWDGVSTVSGEKVSESTFFFVCHVFEPRLKGIVKRTIKGTLQLVR